MRLIFVIIMKIDEMPYGLLNYIRSGNLNCLKKSNNVYLLNTILTLLKHVKAVDYYPDIKFNHLSEETNYDNSVCIHHFLNRLLVI
jgi:hypothetical protein